MRAAAGVLIFSLAGCAHDAEAPISDVDLYFASLLVGLHSHPVGRDGDRIERAERVINRRRSGLREWIVAREGEEAVVRREQEIEEEIHSVYWVRGPSEAEEWDNIARAQSNLVRLERRRRRVERAE